MNDHKWNQQTIINRINRTNEQIAKPKHFSKLYWNMMNGKYHKNFNQKYFINLTNISFKNELKYLNGKQCELIVKLRSEHIRLNNYRFKILNEIKSPICHCQKEIETVEHFIESCEIFNNQRETLLFNLKQIDPFYQNNNNNNTINILFPHIWQKQPRWNDSNYKQIKKDNLYTRIEILKSICLFVKETKRFKKFRL